MRTAVRTSTENLKRATRWHRIRQYHELVYPSYGDPVDVLSFRTDEAITDKDPPQPDLDLVKVEMLHVPWNPADVNTIQGKYPSPYGFSSQNHNNIDRPSAKSRYFDEHLVAGSEGWGRVASSNGKYLKEGSLVTVGNPGLGTLRSSLWVPESSLLHVPEQLLEISGPGGCTLAQLGGTALRMLSDFASLRPGDVVSTGIGIGFLFGSLFASLFVVLHHAHYEFIYSIIHCIMLIIYSFIQLLNSMS
jgi:NADPH:quinone reductase-like Zn-dependent oxidoreductase